MQAIIRHSPITCNGPIYSTKGNSPFPVAVYHTCCAKGSKANSTVAHAVPTHGGTGGFCLPVLAARHKHLCFPICTKRKKGLPIVAFRIFTTYGCGLAELVIKIAFLEGTRAPHTARTPVNGSQVAQDTAHATQHTERAHR